MRYRRLASLMKARATCRLPSQRVNSQETYPTLTKGTRKLVKVMKDHARVHEHAPV